MSLLLMGIELGLAPALAFLLLSALAIISWRQAVTAARAADAALQQAEAAQQQAEAARQRAEQADARCFVLDGKLLKTEQAAVTALLRINELTTRLESRRGKASSSGIGFGG